MGSSVSHEEPSPMYEEHGQIRRGRSKQAMQDQPVGEPVMTEPKAVAAHDGRNEGENADTVETDGASDVGIPCDQRPDNKNPTISTKIPRTPINRLRSPSSSKPSTPYTSTPATPHISRPGTPPIDRPETRGHLPNKPPTSRPKTQENILSPPPVTRTTRQPVQNFAKPKALGTQVLAPKPSHPTSLTPPPPPPKPRAPRHFKSTPHLHTPNKNKPPNLLHPATWPATRTHASSTGKPYTWPRRGSKPYNPSRRSSSAATIPPKQPSTPPSICVHTDLSLHWDRRTLIQRYTRYRCKCNPHELRTQRSTASFRWVDGEPLTAYAHAPEKAEWCYCSAGEGHVVQTQLEAMERYVGLVEGGRVVKMSERQREELEGVEWGATEKALGMQREFPGLRERVRRWVLCRLWWAGEEKGS
ncbi:hypothetical protein Q7P35_004983 [Cladosporium inversicolor]